MNVGPILAALNVDLPKANRGFGRDSTLLLSDILLIVGIGVGLLLVLGAIIYFWMKRRRNPRKHITGGEKVYRGHDHATDALDDGADDADEDHEDADDDDDGGSGDQPHDKRRYKYRVRRRSHRSRNPTLSETGGLPPVKSPEPGKPC